MLVSVRSIAGVRNVPKDRVAIGKWLERNRVKIKQSKVRGGTCHLVALADLPDEVRHAYLEQCVGDADLDMGQYDDAAHDAFHKAPATMRAEAERKAAMARVLVAFGDTVPWGVKLKSIREKFGKKGASKQSLQRVLMAIEGVDPINFAPALLAKFKPNNAVQADVSDKAWAMFMTTIRDAAPTFPLTQAWRDVRDVAAVEGWNWPSYPTIWRRWEALPEAQRQAARVGAKDAARRLTQPALRDKTTIRPLQYVSLDGRTQDYWTDMGDGKPVRLTMLALIDVASNLVLGYELAPSENANSTVRLIRQVCERYGIFDTLYTDNGSAFAGHLVAGGVDHKFRNSATNKGMRPLGICHHLGIRLTFALPGNAQAKIAERSFATLSRSLDDRPEFKGAHAGHNPGAAPKADVIPIPLATVEQVVAREVHRYNTLAGRRAQGANGRSYQEMFMDGLGDRIIRRPTARQLYLSSLVYKPVAVDRDGRVKVDGWTYGGPETQEALIRYHGTGRKITLGRDPDDLSAPALAFDDQNRLICEGIQYVARGAYDSKDGIRDAMRNKQAAQKATRQAVQANAYMDDAEFARAMDVLTQAAQADGAPDMPDQSVVAGAFNLPLKGTEPNTDDKQAHPLVPMKPTQEMLENLDRAIGFDPLFGQGGR